MTKLRDVRVAMTPRIATEWRDARRHGLSVSRWRSARAANLDLLPSMASLQGGLVLDLGANIGDWTSAVLEAVPSVTVIAVEPGYAPHAVLQGRFADDPRVTISACVVADRPGTRRFHLTEHSHNASLQVPRSEMNTYYGHGWDQTSVVEVPATTVDELVDGRKVALLKIDVQGAERDVLRGAFNTLSRTHAVLLEVTFVSHYEGDASFAWLHEHMNGRGFELAGLSQPFLSQHHVALWCDACYIRQV